VPPIRVIPVELEHSSSNDSTVFHPGPQRPDNPHYRQRIRYIPLLLRREGIWSIKLDYTTNMPDEGCIMPD
jgi:hypothetical protein